MEFLQSYGNLYFLVLVAGVVAYFVGHQYFNSGLMRRARTFMIVALACAGVYILGSLVLIFVTRTGDHMIGVLFGGLNAYFAHKALKDIRRR